jgi:hypothetical protein
MLNSFLNGTTSQSKQEYLQNVSAIQNFSYMLLGKAMLKDELADAIFSKRRNSAKDAVVEKYKLFSGNRESNFKRVAYPRVFSTNRDDAIRGLFICLSASLATGRDNREGAGILQEGETQLI